MAEFAGMRHLETQTSTAQILAGRRVRDVSDTIALLDQNNTTLVTLLMRLRKKKATDPKFEWGEDVFLTQYVQLGEGTSSAEGYVKMATADVAKFRTGDVWWYPEHDEVVYVDAIDTAGDQIVFVNAIGETIWTAWDSGDELYYIGNAQATGDTARAQLTTQTTQEYNYCQLFKEPFEVDRTAMSTKLYGGGDMAYLINKHAEEHKRDIERTLWFGERDDLTGADSTNYIAGVGSAAYLTRGVWHYFSRSGSGANTHTNTSELTEDEYNGYLETDMRYGNNVKFQFNSPRACTVIDAWGRDALRMVSRETTGGMVISRYKSTHGEINMIKNNLFADMADTSCATNPATCSIILDLEQLWYRYLNDTELEQNIQENDRDAVEHQYRSEVGLELHLDAHHSGIYGWSVS